MPTTKPYGTWDSTITAEAIGSSITVSDVLVDPIKKVVYHIEQNPEDNSSTLLDTQGTGRNVLPEGYNAQDFVNDYGGAPAIVYGGIVYFSNQADNRIYKLNLNDSAPTATPVTPENTLLRYGNFAVHPVQTQLLVTIREDHTNAKTSQEVVYTLCIVDTTAEVENSVYVLVEGADFYASPVFNPSGTKIAWQQWDLPDMPWFGGIIYEADITTNGGKISVSKTQVVAGAKGAASATFPSWISDTALLYTSDKDNGFQNPYVYDTKKLVSTCILAKQLDFAEPAWYLGLYPYAILGGGAYGAFTAFEAGRNILFIVDLQRSSEPVQIDADIFDFAVAQHLRPLGDDTFVFTGSSRTLPGGVFKGTIQSSSGTYTATFDTLKPIGEHQDWEQYISTPIPKALQVDTFTIYAVYYLPVNPDFVAPTGEKPPCIINVHGGPTGLESQALNWTKTYYTSRGFAWQVPMDVNYRGSSGYGRKYIELLNKNWGYYDVEDCKLAHEILAGEGVFDPKRATIRGGSAGGYTTLSSLTFAPDPGYYKSACSAFGGIADPVLLAQVTEKFESQYINTLFGSGPGGSAWAPRTPLNYVKDVRVPLNLLVLHGEDDPVVPLKVISEFVDEVSKVPGAIIDHKYYPGERHHFVKRADIIDALEREHDWYVKYLL